MINLLPEEKKKDLKRGYMFRVILMGGVLFITALVIFNIVLASMYFILLSEKNQLEANTTITEESTEITQVSKTISDLNKKIAILKRENSNRPFSELLKLVTSKKNEGIQINELSLEVLGEEKKEVVSVGGVAVTRDDFVRFLDALENEEIFEEVISPISNLSKSVNIVFEIQIITVPS